MWLRVASNYPWWFEPDPLASYRNHGYSKVARLARSREMAKDSLKVLKIFEV